MADHKVSTRRNKYTHDEYHLLGYDAVYSVELVQNIRVKPKKSFILNTIFLTV
jgi:hypothetical protein